MTNLPKELCACGHDRSAHRLIGASLICNVYPCRCMDFEAITSNERFDGYCAACGRHGHKAISCPKPTTLRDLQEENDRLRAALHGLEREISSRFGADQDMSPELQRVMLPARAALSGNPSAAPSTSEMKATLSLEQRVALALRVAKQNYGDGYDEIVGILRDPSEETSTTPRGCCDGCKMRMGVCRCLEKALKLATAPEKASTEHAPNCVWWYWQNGHPEPRKCDCGVQNESGEDK